MQTQMFMTFDKVNQFQLKIDLLKRQFSIHFKLDLSESLDTPVEKPVVVEKPVESGAKQKSTEAHEYYLQNRLRIRNWYLNNKERIAKRQQTEEAKATFREQYKKRRALLTPAQITAKNANSKTQRKVREAKLRAKYPGMKLKDAKLAEKATRKGS